MTHIWSGAHPAWQVRVRVARSGRSVALVESIGTRMFALVLVMLVSLGLWYFAWSQGESGSMWWLPIAILGVNAVQGRNRLLVVSRSRVAEPGGRPWSGSREAIVAVQTVNWIGERYHADRLHLVLQSGRRVSSRSLVSAAMTEQEGTAFLDGLARELCAGIAQLRGVEVPIWDEVWFLNHPPPPQRPAPVTSDAPRGPKPPPRRLGAAPAN